MERVWSICGMCTVRCPIEAKVENGEVVFIQGNRHAGMDTSICPRGAAGIALLKDNERPHGPLIRTGARGEGKWRSVGWDEALDYVADQLKDVSNRHGARSILFSDRGGPFADLHQAFVRALGSPNYCNHDTACARNTHHAAQSLFGFGRKGVSYDLKNAAHVVLQTRNIFEAINVKEVKDLTAAMENGCRLSVIDIRSTVTATKANDFYMLRPGTDYAFNLAVIHALIRDRLYDTGFVRQWVEDFDKLALFVEPYSPAWAEEETGVPARRIETLAQNLSRSAPKVIWHPGWNTARYIDSFYVARSAYIINSLLGSIGAKGGLPMVAKAQDVGRKGLNPLAGLLPKPEEKRVDGAGWRYPHLDDGPGLVCRAVEAMAAGDPYAVKAYIAYRHDPLMAMPDPVSLKTKLDHLDFLVSVTFSWSDTAWYSDVVLPLSTYLERESIIAHKAGLKPHFFVRRRAVEPRYDTKPEWWIFTRIAKRMGVEQLAFDSIEDIWKHQLEGTGVTIDDFDKTGQVSLTGEPQYKNVDQLKFKTPSGKIEIINQKWENEELGLESLRSYVSPEHPGEGEYRIVFGRCALHTQGHTVNNPLLNEAMPENELWINDREAARLGIRDGEEVEVTSSVHSGRIKAKVTDGIHPECVFMIHGFGHTLPVETRAYGRGLADNALMANGLKGWDASGGALAMQENFVAVRKVAG
jgi:thiosulfate reductase / polysulfide reductase chain A